MRNPMLVTLVAGAMSLGVVGIAQASPPERADAYMSVPAHQSAASESSGERQALGGRQVQPERAYWRPELVVRSAVALGSRQAPVTFGRVPQAPVGG